MEINDKPEQTVPPVFEASEKGQPYTAGQTMQEWLLGWLPVAFLNKTLPYNGIGEIKVHIDKAP